MKWLQAMFACRDVHGARGRRRRDRKRQGRHHNHSHVHLLLGGAMMAKSKKSRLV